jgi:hypothetical protein
MSEMQGEQNFDAPESTDPSQQNLQVNPGGQSNDPPYAQYLNNIPEAFRGQIEPVFKQWDADVTKRFQGVQSEVAPYRELIQQYDPQSLQQAVQLAELMQADPGQVYQALGATYPELAGGQNTGGQQNQGVQGQQFQQQTPSFDAEEYGLPPQLMQQFVQQQQQIQQFQEAQQQQAQLLELISTGMIQEHQQREEAQQMQQFEQLLGNLKQQYGDYDQDYVLAKIAGGMDPAAAVQDYRGKFSQAVSQQAAQQHPQILTSGGGLPSTQIDPNKLNSQDTKNLVQQLIAQANAQG